ncbi:MAG: type II secretion system protein GspG [Gammaproteobacteria bacterium]|mgnify:CR=1 FL=1|nr:MAG: type II secretion system protein GspG [Gammaproteobacteria bacterium]
MRIEKHGRKQAGFTLIEIMVVVVILAILGAVVVPNLLGNVDEARITKAQTDIGTIEQALDMYRLNNSFYPTEEQGLEALVTKPSGSPEPKKWKQYIKELPKDPWGEEYIYEIDGDKITILSYGSDLQEGGDGTAADITNWNEQE